MNEKYNPNKMPNPGDFIPGSISEKKYEDGIDKKNDNKLHTKQDCITQETNYHKMYPSYIEPLGPDPSKRVLNSPPDKS